ncbi:MAG: carbon monoxide dehydrogenase subunit G [Anaerolineaceae bacterium]
MEIAGQQQFNAPRDVVWKILLDPGALKGCIPGCEEFTEVATQSYKLVVRVGISAIKGSYDGTVKVADITAPDSYRLIVNGRGKPGSVQGDARMTLSDAAGGTLVSYTGEVKAQGAISRLGSRLLGGAAKLMIGQFFKAMENQVAQRTV